MVGRQSKGPTERRAPSIFGQRDLWEIVAAVVLSLATLASAWSGYQAARWTGETVKANRAASVARIDATSQRSIADRQVLIDVTLFSSWLEAEQMSNEKLSASFEDRFRPDFVPAFDSWRGDAEAGPMLTMPLNVGV